MTSEKIKKTFPKPWGSKFERFFVAFVVGAFVYDMGHRLLGVRIELFIGLDGYSIAWVAAMFLVPFLTGIVVSLIYGWGGKLLAHFPPLVVLSVHYYDTFAISGIPEGTSLIPLMWWGFFVILNMEFCAVGGVIGEVLLKWKYGTLDMPGTADYAPADAEHLPRDEDSR